MSRTTCALALTLACFAALATTTATAAVPRNLPGADLLPIRGMDYAPTPSDYKPCGEKSSACPVYYGSDFFNADFPALWDDANGGRGDLSTMASQLKVNFLHLYDWDPARNHLPALNKASSLKIRVAVPISDYFVFYDPNAPADIEKILRQVYVDAAGNPSKTPHPAVKMLLIANEPENTAGWQGRVAQAAANIVKAERAIGATHLLPVAVPFSFSIDTKSPNADNPKNLAAVGQVHSILAQLKVQPGVPSDFIAKRYVAATNPQNDGAFMRNWLPQFAAAVPKTSLWFSEQGAGVDKSCVGYPSSCKPSEQQQATFNAAQFAATKPQASNVLLGGAQFEWINEPWKPRDDSTDNERTFGIYKFSGPFTTATNKDGTYRVDKLAQKPSWTSLKNAFSGAFTTQLDQSELADDAPDGLATVAKKGSVLTYAADAGVANDVKIRRAGGTYTVADLAARLVAGTGCEPGSNDHEVRCSAEGITRVSIDGADGDDKVIDETPTPSTIACGTGDDRVVAGRGDLASPDCERVKRS